jgi:ribosomal protein L31
MFHILSESFIEKFQSVVSMFRISNSQPLSESFIEKFKDRVDWNSITTNQVLSESFIEKFQHEVDWANISKYQKLTESFIEKHFDKVDLYYISASQILSESFIDKFKDKIDIDIYNKHHKEFTYDERLVDMTAYAKKYNLKFDGKTLIAYRQHDKLGRGKWSNIIRYEVGKYYRDWHCDMDITNGASFGLGIFPKGNVKVSVDIDDWGLWLHRCDSGKCRIWGFTVLEQN